MVALGLDGVDALRMQSKCNRHEIHSETEIYLHRTRPHWLLFVKACSLLCNRYLEKENVTLADHYLHLFCQKFVEVYGSNACTPNMHLHLHLKECLIDYGPLYAFWCFAFERYNGM